MNNNRNNSHKETLLKVFNNWEFKGIPEPMFENLWLECFQCCLKYVYQATIRYMLKLIFPQRQSLHRGANPLWRLSVYAHLKLQQQHSFKIAGYVRNNVATGKEEL